MIIVKVPEQDGRAERQIYFTEDPAASAAPSGWSAEDHRDTARERVVEASRDALEDAVDLARVTASRFASALTSMSEGVRKPDEITLELTIGLDSQVGAILAKASASAEFHLTVKWVEHAQDA